ncbi:hypothetical protein [Streptococcus agalactiae]|uniref:hypothetical protein n=1 Tax=Streptococcus agalactiae TaxID=1311 RepID=UPI00085C2357|nr:hypothetical protein [Streptococcus agalactiae]
MGGRGAKIKNAVKKSAKPSIGERIKQAKMNSTSTPANAGGFSFNRDQELKKANSIKNSDMARGSKRTYTDISIRFSDGNGGHYLEYKVFGKWAKKKGYSNLDKKPVSERDRIFNEYAKTQSVRLINALSQEPIMWR